MLEINDVVLYCKRCCIVIVYNPIWYYQHPYQMLVEENNKYHTGMDKTCVYTSFYGFICVSGTDCVQVRYRHIRQAAIPARVVLGTAVFCDQSNQYLVYEFPFCAMHMRVSSVSLPYLQNRLPSLIISAILAQYSSLCDHLVLQFNLG